MILCVVLMFTPFMAGGVRELAGVLTMGEHFNDLSRLEDVYLWTYLAAYGIHWVYELGICMAFGALGRWKRLRDRKLLYAEKNEEPSKN